MTYRVQGACVDVEFLVLGPIENNVYIIGDGDACFVVDPSCHAKQILAALDGRVPEAIFITHSHWDHTGAAAELREATGAPVVASAVDAPFITGEQAMHGHHRLNAPCPVDRTVGDGDTLFAGTHGRTDFDEGDPAAMRKSLMRLAQLPGGTIVLPGHNAMTTIAKEQPWLQRGGITR